MGKRIEIKFVQELSEEEVKTWKSAISGGVELVKMHLDEGLPVSPQSVSMAAEKGKLGVVQYLLEHGAKAGEDAIALAVWGYHPRVVKYLMAHQAPIDERAVRWAVKNWDLKMVKYLVENGAPVHPDELITANRYGYDEISKYLSQTKKLFFS